VLGHDAQQRGDGALAVGAGDADDGCVRIMCEEFDVTQHRHAESPRFGDEGGIDGDAGREHHAVGALQRIFREAPQEHRRVRQQGPQIRQARRAFAAVGDGDLLAVRRQETRAGQPGLAEADDQRADPALCGG
jgi:hypothetical protein